MFSSITNYWPEKNKLTRHFYRSQLKQQQQQNKKQIKETPAKSEKNIEVCGF